MARLLPEVCQIQYGFPFDSARFTTADGTPLIRIRDVVRGYSETYTTEECDDAYIVNDGDMLVGMDGEFNIARWKGGRAYLNQRVCRLLPKAEICPEYLFHFMPGALKRIENQTPFATVKHLSAKQLNAISIPLPSMEEQQHIAKQLETVDALISLRKQQIAKLDELVKSRFVAMFGDPIENPKNWATQPLNAVCQTIVDCPHSTPNYTSENTGYMCIRTSIVKKNKILWDEIEYISEAEYIKRIQRKKPEMGDIVYTREGAILGIAAIIDRNCNVALGQRSMLLSPDSHRCCSEFLCVAMNFDTFLRKALGGISGSASPHINVGDIKAFDIILPPLDFQHRFAAFIAQIDQQKLTIQQSLAKLEMLKKSLMQRYFR